jgi:hypothetical protein
MKDPKGVYVAIPCDDPAIATQPLWTNPGVTGVLLRTFWANVEPSPGQYDFSYFDQGMALCQQHGKHAIMSVNSGLADAPDWIWAVSCGFPLAIGGVTLCPWNLSVQARWNALVASWASRFDANPLLDSVTMWAGGKGIECFFADTYADVATLATFGGPSAWLAGAKALVEAFNSFQNTSAWLAVGNPCSDANVTMSDLARWFIAFANGNGVQCNALTGNYPGGSIFPHTSIPIANIPLIGYQTLNSLDKPSMQGQTVQGILANAQRTGAKWVQLYPGDLALDTTGAILKFNAEQPV